MAITLAFEDVDDCAPMTMSGAVITIGRVAGNDIVLGDARISSRHGRLVRQGEGYVYEDLGSRNGSMLERDGQKNVLKPHEPTVIVQGDRLLLGDLVTPVVVLVRRVPRGFTDYDGGTVVAHRSAIMSENTWSGGDDEATRNTLFDLLHAVSGKTDPAEVLGQIGSAILARFEHADSLAVLLKDAHGEWVDEYTQSRDGQSEPLAPSSTLLKRAVEGLEVVSYLPDSGPQTASVVGVAGAVILPLVSGQEVFGVLHVSSTTRHFDSDALAWLTIVTTHVTAALVSARRFRALAHSEQKLRVENDSLKSAATMARPILGRSEALQKALKQLEKVGRTEATVLVTGETGTGKELAARFVHAHSRRQAEVFAPINCGALTEELLNSELFGHKKGAFTGADRDRKGLFEAAEGGTVFLDEIGEVSPTVQVRLLRVLQEREVQPVGSNSPIKVNVRIVAATNRDLQEEVKNGNFREDLYYRLAVFSVRLPPLRERGLDIELLSDRFRESACARHDAWVSGISLDAQRALKAYHWPGNIRQLEHEIERAVILADEGGCIELNDLSDTILGQRSRDDSEAELPYGRLRDVMAELEERVIRRCLDEHGGNRTRAAEFLGISRQALQVKLAKWKDDCKFGQNED